MPGPLQFGAFFVDSEDMTATRTATRHQLFRNLQSAEHTAHAYAELVALFEHSALITRPGAEIARIELARLRETMEEHENDADDCRDRILSAGYSYADYDAWQAAR